MRLIDADELKTKAFGKRGGLVHTSDIDHAPTVDPVKHGRWIQHGVGHENVPWGFDCSECAEWFVIDRQYITRYRYCPNCGAKMDEVEE